MRLSSIKIEKSEIHAYLALVSWKYDENNTLITDRYAAEYDSTDMQPILACWQDVSNNRIMEEDEITSMLCRVGSHKAHIRLHHCSIIYSLPSYK